jgi:hypothetical protein
MAFSNIGTINSPASGQNLPGGSAGLSAASGTGDNVVQDFLNYLKESPIERMFDAWLKAHHLSKQQFDALSPQQKQALLDEFKKEFETKAKAEAGDIAKLSLANFIS